MKQATKVSDLTVSEVVSLQDFRTDSFFDAVDRMLILSTVENYTLGWHRDEDGSLGVVWNDDGELRWIPAGDYAVDDMSLGELCEVVA